MKAPKLRQIRETGAPSVLALNTVPPPLAPPELELPRFGVQEFKVTTSIKVEA